MLQDLLLDNPRHGVCLPAPLTTTSRDRERGSSLRPPLPEVGRAPGAEPLSPLALTRRPAPSWPQHRLVTGARRGGTGPGPPPCAERGGSGRAERRRARVHGLGTGTETETGARAVVRPWARPVALLPFACSQSPCPPAQHLRPRSAPKASALLRPPFPRSLPPAVSFIPLQPSLLHNSGSVSLHPRLWLHPSPACGACPSTVAPLPGPDRGQAQR